MAEDGPAENAATFPIVCTSRKEEKTKIGAAAQIVDKHFEEKTHSGASLFYYPPSSYLPIASKLWLQDNCCTASGSAANKT